MDTADICFARALEVLGASVCEHGIVASQDDPHYAAVWTRDAGISAIAASAASNAHLLEAVRRTVESLAELQTPQGLVPNAYWPSRGYWDWGETGCADAQAWFIIAAWLYFVSSRDVGFLKRVWPLLNRTLTWLQCQDSNNFGLIDSQPSADWMDSSLNRSGKVLQVNLLYFWATRSMQSMADELGLRVDASHERIADRVNLLFWPDPRGTFENLLGHVGYKERVKFPHPCSVQAYRNAAYAARDFYVSSVSFGNFVDRCDVLANCLALVLDVAPKGRVDRVLKYMAAERVSDPYPVRVWAQAFSRHDRWDLVDREAERFQDSRWRNRPYEYHNAGVWPYVGGMYVVALARHGDRELAERELSRLAEANRQGLEEWSFHEWLDGRSGKPGGATKQCWSAAMFVAAYRAVRDGVFPE